MATTSAAGSRWATGSPRIPIGRTFDPVTGADWEGVGVAPDVAVPAVQALDEAVRRATQR